MYTYMHTHMFYTELLAQHILKLSLSTLGKALKFTKVTPPCVSRVPHESHHKEY